MRASDNVVGMCPDTGYMTTPSSPDFSQETHKFHCPFSGMQALNEEPFLTILSQHKFVPVGTLNCCCFPDVTHHQQGVLTLQDLSPGGDRLM